MNRRDFIKSLGLYGSSILVPSLFGGMNINANASSLSSRRMINARAAVLGEIGYVAPTVVPQVISVFLYGGPSELAGNLTNIEDINANSQNPYNSNLMPDANNPHYTTNGFWGNGASGNGFNAGGEAMERMVASKRMSVYRTINRVKDDSKAHRPSIFSNLTGMIGVDDSRPGIATNLASILSANGMIADNALFPFVTFEGESVVFNQGSVSVPAGLKPISLNENFRNPYSRRANSSLESTEGDQDAAIEALAQATMAGKRARYQKVIDAFGKRGEIEGFVSQLNQNLANTQLPVDPDFVAPIDDPGAAAPILEYPRGFGDRLKAAVNLVIHNPDSLFVSLGNNGLGGWDDHNSAQDDYPGRMRNLMESLEVAAKHLEAAGKDNVIIMVYGEFGRNVNLNGSMGWDHGNNQNLYLVGASPSAGPGIAGNELGKIVGKTKRIGKAKVNRQFTSPTDDSYQCEPFAVASTIYQYFGVQNPELLTGEAPIDETGTPNEWKSIG
ncbi:MAG TPA: DUF1501 domain-containing protein [Gammaproteobacteria bacterium]|nr:DUF1501 domain-containing protein [Gammaproteobacteria bacterium]